MKTIEEFLKEVAASKELKEELSSIKDKDALAAFLKKSDWEATADDFAAYMDMKLEGDISDDEAETAAGGKGLWISFPKVGESMHCKVCGKEYKFPAKMFCECGGRIVRP